MTKEIVFTVVIMLISGMGVFFWHVINTIRSIGLEAHCKIEKINDRVTEQATRNANTYARRDDVVHMKIEILDAINELKKDMRRLD